MEAKDLLKSLPPNEKKEAWFKLIEEQQSTGESQLGFCKARDLKVDLFRYYRRKWVQKNNILSKKATFVSVEVDEPEKRSWNIKITRSGELNLEFPVDFSIGQLSELIRTLRQALCECLFLTQKSGSHPILLICERDALVWLLWFKMNLL